MMENRIFVFGSNRAGRHGAGSAKEALTNHGAIYGQGEGFQGNSYAIPTKNSKFETLSLEQIRVHALLFCIEAASRKDLIFDVVKIGCGLAGYTESQIAPLFLEAPSNCNLPKGWRELNGYGCYNRPFTELCVWSETHFSPRCTGCSLKNNINDENKKRIDNPDYE